MVAWVVVCAGWRCRRAPGSGRMKAQGGGHNRTQGGGCRERGANRRAAASLSGRAAALWLGQAAAPLLGGGYWQGLHGWARCVLLPLELQAMLQYAALAAELASEWIVGL